MYRVYLHEFCKVVTSEVLCAVGDSAVYLHEFCKVVTSESRNEYYLPRCTYMDFVRLLDQAPTPQAKV